MIFLNCKKVVNNNVILPKVNVLFVTDNNYVLPTRTAIRSIIANKNRKTKIEIYIIGVNLTNRSVSDLKKEERKNIRLNIIDISQVLNFPKVENVMNASRADNSKLFLSSVLSDINKIIYLDGDVIVLKDLSKLYNIELENNYAGVVDDWQSNWKDNKSARYFNNGMMLLNLKKMREHDIDNKLKIAKKNDKIRRFVTQDAYNTVMKEKVLFLPLIYNTFCVEFDDNDVTERIKNVLSSYFNPLIYPYKNAKAYRKDVVVIHYCGYGNLKPWWKLDFGRISNRIWYRYAPLDFWIYALKGKCKPPYIIDKNKGH